MPALVHVQRGFRRALLDTNSSTLASLVELDGLSADSRIGLYRTNVIASLTTCLKATFPAVCKLVDERFFAYAANEFVRAHPPTRPCLVEYGAEFADFLSDFEPCRSLVYLADVARLEWLIHTASAASDALPLPPSWGALLAKTGAELVLRLDPAIGLLRSQWPVDLIWRTNCRDLRGDISIELVAGTTCIVVGRYGDEVTFWTIDAAIFDFIARVRKGTPLRSAAEATIAMDKSFELSPALQFLFGQQLVVGLRLP
jgi:hypothetical protein